LSATEIFIVVLVLIIVFAIVAAKIMDRNKNKHHDFQKVVEHHEVKRHDSYNGNSMPLMTGQQQMYPTNQGYPPQVNPDGTPIVYQQQYPQLNQYGQPMPIMYNPDGSLRQQ
jgi:hypothetical protein